MFLFSYAHCLPRFLLRLFECNTRYIYSAVQSIFMNGVDKPNDPFQHFINERILELHRIGERRIIRKSLRKAVKSEGKSGRSSVSCCHFEAFIRSVGYVGPDREKRKDRSRGRKEGRLTVYRATISEARRYRAWEGVELGVGNEADEGASCISMGRART